MSECELMHRVVEAAYWKIAYHEKELGRAHKFLAVAHGLVQRTGLEVTEREAQDAHNENEDETDCETPLELLAYTLGSAMNSIAYHEAGLREAHNHLAQAKALALRAAIEVPFEEIEAEARKRAAT